MRNIKNRTLFLISIIMILMSCRNEKDGSIFLPFSSGNSALDSNKRMWAEYALGGDYDSLIDSARPFLSDAISKGDSFAVCQSGIFMAQAFLFQENLDSTKYYLDKYNDYFTSCDDPGFGIVFGNVQGVYSLKAELDYAKAFDAFSKGLACADRIGDVENSIVLLSNIVSIFYIRQDRSGMQYAEQAFSLANDNDVDPQYIYISMVSMAQMYFIAGDYDRSYSILQKASEYYDGEENAYSAVSYLLYADLYDCMGDYEKSEYYYNKALGCTEYLEPAYVSLAYLKYGNFMLGRSRNEEALDLYRKGLEISYENDNHEFRRILIKAIADLYYDNGNNDGALEYYHQYVSYLDSVSLPYRDMEFSSLLMMNQKQKHDLQIQMKELDLEKANRRTVVMLLCMSFAIVLAVVVSLYRRKQIRLYRSLVSRYQESVNTVNQVKNHSDADGLRAIFLNLEKLMQEDKIYNQKDITLDKVATMLGTNRTYVSKCINNFAGKSFYGYIDMYRIREATSIISSEDGASIPFKTISDNLGYKSPSVFYKAFSREVGVTPGRYRECLKYFSGHSEKNGAIG